MTDERKPLDTQLHEMLGDAYDKAQEVVAKEEVKEEVKEVKEEKPKKEAKSPKVKEPKEEKEIEAPETAAEESVETEEITDQSVVKPEVVAPVSQAPDHWSAGAKAHWDKLDPVVRAEALKQQDFVNKLQSRHAQERKKYEAVESVVAPHEGELIQYYGSKENGLKTLFALSDLANRDPVGFIQRFSQQRGIDLRGLVQNQPQRAIDPTVTALQQQIEQLSQHINGMSQSQEKAVMSDIDRSYKDFAANPANKYLNDVREDMAFFIESGKANDWQTAYNMAVKINPAVSELIESEKLSQLEEKRRKEAEEAAAKAQKAKALNVSTKGVVSVTAKSGDWTNTLRETGDKLMGA